MNGLEMMLSRLIGMTPEQMKAQVNEATAMMRNGANAMASLDRKLDLIMKHLGIDDLEELNNGGRAIANRRNGNGDDYSVTI